MSKLDDSYNRTVPKDGWSVNYEHVLTIAANWAAILTATVAVIAYGRYIYQLRIRTRRLEDYLREEKLRDHDQGKRTVLHLMAHLGMTESELLGAAFRSKKVETALGIDFNGREEVLIFEYMGDDAEPKGPF